MRSIETSFPRHIANPAWAETAGQFAFDEPRLRSNQLVPRAAFHVKPKRGAAEELFADFHACWWAPDPGGPRARTQA